MLIMYENIFYFTQDMSYYKCLEFNSAMYLYVVVNGEVGWVNL